MSEQKEYFVGDLIESARQRSQELGPTYMASLKSSEELLCDVAMGKYRGFVIEPEEGAISFGDYRFVVDTEDVGAPIPDAPKGYIHLTGAPIARELAASLADQIRIEESKARG